MATAAFGSSILRVITARWAPPMRKRRVMARVSMPVIPATPDFSIRSASVPWARQLDTRGDRSRTTKPAQ